MPGVQTCALPISGRIEPAAVCPALGPTDKGSECEGQEARKKRERETERLATIKQSRSIQMGA